MWQQRQKQDVEVFLSCFIILVIAMRQGYAVIQQSVSEVAELSKLSIICIIDHIQ